MILVEKESDLPMVAKQLLEQMEGHSIVLFKGPMGVGKTTLIKAICTALHVTSETSSPTFSLINEYETDKGELIYHFDFYRLENEEEAFDYGYEEYFYSGNLCLIEWPEKIPNLIPEDCITVTLELIGPQRKITVA